MFLINGWYNLIFKISIKLWKSLLKFYNLSFAICFTNRFSIYFQFILNINLKIINNELNFDIYRKPAHSFGYLHYKDCTHRTRKTIVLSLARHIVRIVTDNKNNRLEEVKDHLLKRKHLDKILDYSFTKLFQSREHESNDKKYYYLH